MTVVVDTSALICMLLDEPLATAVETELAADADAQMSAATFVETMIVAEGRKGPAGAQKIDEMIREADISIVEHDPDSAKASVDGWRRYGKGRHPAALNLGDCYAYGLARTLGVAILCVGDDFRRTDATVVPDTE